jgi:S-adenosylmethionine:tRNA ribosyltransferase-isomerase
MGAFRQTRCLVSVLTKDYDYPLPEHLIARYPLERREASRMMVLHRAERRIEHRLFADFPQFIVQGDLVVLNNTRVIPARIFSDDGRIELLFLETVAPLTWKCLVKPGRKMRVGASLVVAGVSGRVVEILPDGERIIAFDSAVDLESRGQLPLPPYFERPPEKDDAERYQTVYAKEKGSVAAPTAGLHFTPEVLSQVPHAFVTLHVGVGTFRPVQTEVITEHRMHLERFALSEETSEAINCAERVVAVGTTTCRVLESCARDHLPLQATNGATDIFIHPPYKFRVVNSLLTNFHLPKTTLLMLVSALAGREFVIEAYNEAIREGYRFYSYGDCMLIV